MMGQFFGSRYVPALQGVMLAHNSLQFTTPKAVIKGDCPFANCTVSFDATVWSPRIGMKLGELQYTPIICIVLTSWISG